MVNLQRLSNFILTLLTRLKEMYYKDFQTYIDLINYIRDLTIEDRDKKDLLSLVRELCDEVEETNYDSGYNAGYCVGYKGGWKDSRGFSY